VLDPRLLAFIRTSIPSIWALEVLLALRAAQPRFIPVEELVRTLRATTTLIERLLRELSAAGLVERDPKGASRYHCASADLAELCDALAEAAVERPVALRDAIVASPSSKLRDFANAFRITGGGKKDE
jgi:DNA-binding HxlR family transcriptional regulator